MVETLQGLQAGTITPQPQDNSRASLAPILKKEDGRINFDFPAAVILDRLRGFQPWPGAFTTFRGKGLQVWAALAAPGSVPPAELLVKDGKLIAGCGAGTALELLEIQPQGKRRMTAREFLQGYRPQTGERLGE
jgi:methionyl-tRNA formyltransferase